MFIQTHAPVTPDYKFGVTTPSLCSLIVKQNWFAKNGIGHRDTKAQGFRSCFEFLQKVFLGLSAPVLRQIARYLPHSKDARFCVSTHPKSSHDKFKTASYFLREQSLQSKSLVLWHLPSLYIYFSVSLCLCVQ